MKSHEDGAYRLNLPVKNPTADRRSKRDWRKAQTFEPGIYYIASTQMGGLRVEHVSSEYGLYIASLNMADFQPLLDALEPEVSLEHHLRYMERIHHVRSRDVLVRLVESNILSETTVYHAVKLQKNYEDTKEG